MLLADNSWIRPVAHYMAHEGLTTTLKIAAASVVASALIGIVLGVLLTIDWLPSRAVIRLYIEIWRGLPIVVTIFLIYFGLPSLGVSFNAWHAGALGLTLWGSAQVAETARGAVQSIPREQHEAASALGFGWLGRHAFVILPQALRRLTPPLVSLLVNVIQNSTLVALIGGVELLKAAQIQTEGLQLPEPTGIGEFHGFELYGAVMATFFVISFPLTRLAAYLERRLI
jgi:His/Glu/Gln/Arg/opine family amino acid ABC transporter permease subunit